MIMGRLDKPWLRRMLFVGVNGALLLVVCVMLVLPIRDMREAREAEIAQQRHTLARLQAIADRETEVRRLLAAAGTASTDGEALTGANEGVATAALQARLKSLTTAAGAKLRSVQGLPLTKADGFAWLGARVQMVGSLAAIARAVHAIETAKPYLYVATAVIRAPPALHGAAGEREPVIEAQLDVAAVFQREEGE